MNDNTDIKGLLDAWDQLIDEWRNLPKEDVVRHDLRAQDIAEHGIGIGARFDDVSTRDPFLEDIRYDFGPLGAMGGEEADELWEQQARLVKEARRKYGLPDYIKTSRKK